MSCNTEEVQETSKSKIRLVRLKIKEGATNNEYQYEEYYQDEDNAFRRKSSKKQSTTEAEEEGEEEEEMVSLNLDLSEQAAAPPRVAVKCGLVQPYAITTLPTDIKDICGRTKASMLEAATVDTIMMDNVIYEAGDGK